MLMIMVKSYQSYSLKTQSMSKTNRKRVAKVASRSYAVLTDTGVIRRNSSALVSAGSTLGEGPTTSSNDSLSFSWLNYRHRGQGMI